MTDDEYQQAVDKIIHHVSVGLIPFVPPKGEPDLPMIGNLLASLVCSGEEALSLEIATGLLCSQVGISRRMNLDRWLELVKYDRAELLQAALEARVIVELLLEEAKAHDPR